MSRRHDELSLNLHEFGERLKFAMVRPDDLKIDRKYQRDLTDLVEFIGSNFDPLAFICVLVAERETGDRYLVDGQQRTKGAKIAGKKEVPAIIFRSEGPEQEARLFQYINQFRKAVTAIDIFRASLAAGDKDVIAIHEAVLAADFKIAFRRGLKAQWPYVSAVEQLTMIYKQSGPEAITETLRLIGVLWPEENEALRREAIRGVYSLHRAFGVTLDENLLKMKFQGVSMPSIFTKAQTIKARARQRGVQMALYQCVFQALRTTYGRQVPPMDKAHPPKQD